MLRILKAVRTNEQAHKCANKKEGEEACKE